MNTIYQKKFSQVFVVFLIYCSFHISFPVLPVFFRCVARKVSNFMFLKLFIFNESFRLFSNVIRCSTEKNKHSLAFGLFLFSEADIFVIDIFLIMISFTHQVAVQFFFLIFFFNILALLYSTLNKRCLETWSCVCG